MTYATYPFTLELQKTLSQISIPVTLNDTHRAFLISLTNGGKPYRIADGCRATYSGTKSDGTILYNDCVITDNTVIRYDFTEQTTSAPGRIDCQLILYGEDGGIIASPRFTLVVYKCAVNINDKVSKNEKTTIEGILARETDRIVSEEERKKSFSEMMDIFGNLGGIAVQDEKPTNKRIVAWVDSNAEDEAVEIPTKDDLGYVTPQMFGAKGDGVTDDTEAIQTAVNSRRVIYFPKGTYCVTKTITVPAMRKIIGDQSTISCNVSGVEAVFATAENSTMITFENIIIVGNMDIEEQGKGSTIGIYFLHNSHYITIKDVTLRSHNYALKEYDTLYLFSMTNVRAMYCNNAFAFDTAGEKTTFTLIGCEAECCGNAYKFRHLTYGNLISCGADYCNYPTSNPYGKGYGSFKTGNGVYHFHNCRGITISGCGTEYCYGQGALYANASDVVVNNLKCCGVKSRYVPNFSSYPDYGVGIVTTGTERTRLVINNIINDGFTDEYTPTVYPSRKTPLVAYNYAEGTYGAHGNYDITVNSIESNTVFGGMAGSKYCLHINALRKSISTGRLNLGGKNVYAQKQFSVSSYTKLVLPFNANANGWRPTRVRVEFLEHNETKSSADCFVCEFSTTIYTSCGTIKTISKSHDGATLSSNGLNVEITLPFTPTNSFVSVETMGWSGTLNYDNIALA